MIHYNKFYKKKIKIKKIDNKNKIDDKIKTLEKSNINIINNNNNTINNNNNNNTINNITINAIGNESISNLTYK